MIDFFYTKYKISYIKNRYLSFFFLIFKKYFCTTLNFKNFKGIFKYTNFVSIY